MSQDPFNATLIERIDLNEELALFRVKYDNGHLAEFSPGQFATLGLPDPEAKPKPQSPSSKRKNRGPKLIRRAYSISSPPSTQDYIEFYIVLVEEGQLTPKLWKLKSGDRIFMGEKITGNFTLDGVSDGKNLIMFGTGTGLAPYHSMYLNHRGAPRWNNFVVFDGCRYIRDLGYRQEMETFAKEDESFTYFPTVTREPDDADWAGLRGRVTQYIKPDVFKQTTSLDLNPKDCHVFLCGNPTMIDQCEESLIEQGFVTKDREHPDGNIHLERYW